MGAPYVVSSPEGDRFYPTFAEAVSFALEHRGVSGPFMLGNSEKADLDDNGLTEAEKGVWQILAEEGLV